MIEVLREKSEWLMAPEGRELLKCCRNLVRDTSWETVVFPKPQSPESRERARAVEQSIEEFHLEFVDIKTEPLSYEAVKAAVRARCAGRKEGA